VARACAAEVEAVSVSVSVSVTVSDSDSDSDSVSVSDSVSDSDSAVSGPLGQWMSVVIAGPSVETNGWFVASAKWLGAGFGVLCNR
jgi:hypothetical protein